MKNLISKQNNWDFFFFFFFLRQNCSATLSNNLSVYLATFLFKTFFFLGDKLRLCKPSSVQVTLCLKRLQVESLKSLKTSVVFLFSSSSLQPKKAWRHHPSRQSWPIKGNFKVSFFLFVSSSSQVAASCRNFSGFALQLVAWCLVFTAQQVRDIFQIKSFCQYIFEGPILYN